MRTIDDLRQRLLTRLAELVHGDGLTLLDDLCFIDERAEDMKAVEDDVNRYGERGIVGPFVALFGEGRYAAEVASVVARYAHRLSYLDLDAEESGRLDITAGELRARFDEVDARRSEIAAEFGPPALTVDTVDCYLLDDDWAFFDFAPAVETQIYVPNEGYRYDRDDDLLLRDIRVPADDFTTGLILTRYGKTLRWGPGWQTDHSTRPRSPESLRPRF